ncbi:MAG: AAA family ATPase [Caldilinea sp.]|nr:AAA family ATPase [Caldilinea sp.]
MALPNSDTSLLIRTKLHPPSGREDSLVRPRLLARLHQGLGQRMILLSAPAGYGKTTLIRDWLRTLDCPWAWLSLDEYDDNLSTFVAYLVAALRTVHPHALPVTDSLVQALPAPETERLADTLASELEQLPGPLVLVLDDYHAVRDPEIHRGMNRLLERLPAPIHLVVSTRSDPPFALAALRGRGQLAEIRGRNLRFTPEESADLLERFAGERLNDEVAALIADRTEGWPVGLQLAAISLQDSDNRGDFARRFAEGNSRLIADYLLREVLDNLPEQRRSLMLRTALLERFCAPLCEFIAAEPVQRGDGDRFIGDIWAANLFLTSLDAEGAWYRYHHLFRDMMVHQLQQRCAPEEIAALHLRASEWYEAHDLITEAVIHAVRSGHDARAAQLVEGHFVEALDREDWRLLDRWLSLLPEPVLQRPMLSIARAYLQQFNYAGMITFLEQAEQALSGAERLYSPEQVRFVRGSAALLRAFSLSRTEVSSPARYLALSQQGLALLSGHNGYARGLAELSVIVCMQRVGQRAAALAIAQHSLHEQLGQSDTRTMRLLLATCLVHYAEADVNALQPIAGTYLQLAQDARQELSQGWANFFLGWSHYQRNELTLARNFFGAVVQMRHTAHSLPAVDSLIGIVLTLQALGETGAAQEMIAVLRSLLLERRMLALMPIADMLEVRLAGGQDRGGMPDGHADPAEAQSTLFFWTSPALIGITFALEGAATVSQVATMEKILSVYRSVAQEQHSRRSLLTIGALETLLYDARGNREAALNSLHATVLLGAAGGALRVFVDAGARLIPYFRTLLEQDVAPEYVRRILAAYGETVATTDARQPVVDAALMLTARELDVLRLLDARMTDKEIARKLCVSTRTVQRHTSNIYEKLHVHTRQEAVTAARALGIAL